MSTGKVHEKILPEAFTRSPEAPEAGQREGREDEWSTAEAPEPFNLFADGEKGFALQVALARNAELEL